MVTFLRVIAVFACVLTLAACDSSEERAEKHFQNGLELLQAGDVTRAMVEFRNVLALDESHREARLTYARAARDQGNIPESYANFLRIAEQYPDDMEARLALTEMSILAQNWDEAERHGARLAEASAEVEGNDVVQLALRFREASANQDAAAMRELTREAEALFETNPNDPILVRLLIEGYLGQQELEKAISLTESTIQAGTDNALFYEVQAELLARKGDTVGLESHLRRMVERFPENGDAKRNLIRLLVSTGDADGAESFLRDEIAIAEDKVTAHVDLIALIRQLRGEDAALAEIETALAAYDSPGLMVALKAGILFDAGDNDTAISLLEGIVEGAEPSEETDRLKVTLARMLIATGNEVGARQLVEAVLDHDSNQVEALKMQANWQIDGDQMDAAISTLRRALDQEPDDAEAMTIMARAHERNGDKQLAQDLLALAVEASGNAPGESLRFARVLMQQEQFSGAEETVINALRRAPGRLDLLETLGQIYLATEDWGRAQQVADTLRRQEQDTAVLAADELQLQIISRREGRDQGIGFLEQLIADGTDSSAAKVALIRAKLEENKGDEALRLAQQLVVDLPDNPRARLVLGNTQLALSDYPAAEATFREVIAADSTDTLATMQLVRVLGAQGRLDDAEALIDKAIVEMPESPDLLWAKASFMERENDIDGAIGIYERLYALDSNSPVIANNLASLLATYRTDQESLDRAYTVGRRLRGTETPPFQDTYGWILFRQGSFDEAVTYLEPAATALATDPIVQYHLGRTYVALGRDADALEQFRKVLELAPENDPRPQIAEAKAEIDRISAKASE